MHHPQVLHIGFSKCASTYLRALFRAHPGIHLVFKSGFFVPFQANAMSFSEYQALFSCSASLRTVESDEHLTLPGIHPELGVRTTNLAEFETIADRIRAFLPDTKIIMIIRNQASLIASRYSEYLITGGSLAFEDFVARLMGEPGQENTYYQNYYSRIIALLEERFPRSQLLVLLQEAMRGDMEQTATVLARFMELEGDLVLKRGLRAERRSLSLLGMRLLRWLNRQLVRRPSFGDAPPDTRVPLGAFRHAVRLVRALDYLVFSRFSAPSSLNLTEERRNAILEHFRDDNLRLQRHLGRELGSFGYFAAKDVPQIPSGG